MSEEGGAVVTETPVVNIPSNSEIPVINVTPQKEVVEASTPEVEVVVEEKIAPKLSKLKEREVALAKREAEVNQKFEDAAAKLSTAQKTTLTIEALKTNPSKALAELGISFNDLAKALLAEEVEGDSTPSELDEVKKSLSEIQAELSAKKEAEAKTAEQQEQEFIDNTIADIKNRISAHIDSDPEKYDLIQSFEGKELVYQIIWESYEQTGEAMNYLEACDHAENYFTNELLKKLEKSKKAKALFNPPKTKTSFGKTLSSQATQIAAATSSEGRDLSKLSHEERIRVLANGARIFN